MNSLKSLSFSVLKLLALVLALFVASFGMAMEQDQDHLDEQLYEAVKLDKPAMVEEFLKKGANKHKVDLRSAPLHYAAAWGRLSCLEIFFKHGANPNLLGTRGRTPLHQAASEDKLSCLKLLIEKGANIKARNEFGSTPLHSAALWYRTSCVKALLEHGADPNATDNNDGTPLHKVADAFGFMDQDNKIECIKTLICGGAKVTAKNNAGETPLDLLKDGQRNEISQWYYNLLSGALFLRQWKYLRRKTQRNLHISFHQKY